MIKITYSLLITFLYLFSLTFLLVFFNDIAVSPVGIDEAFFGATILTAIGFFVILLWLIPVHFLLSYLRLNSMIWYMAAGLVPAAFLIFMIQQFSNGDWGTSLSTLVTLGGVGCSTSLVFWYFCYKTK